MPPKKRRILFLRFATQGHTYTSTKGSDIMLNGKPLENGKRSPKKRANRNKKLSLSGTTVNVSIPPTNSAFQSQPNCKQTTAPSPSINLTDQEIDLSSSFHQDSPKWDFLSSKFTFDDV